MNKAPTYLVRWKGQQLGPFTKEVIEQQVRDHDLSLAHEIQVDGKWRSLRGFLNLQAQTQEQERQRIRLKRMQDELDQKEVALQDAKTQAEEAKKRPALKLRPSTAETSVQNSGAAEVAGPKSNNPIDKLKEQFRRKG